ncbi:hypothetical protein ACFQ1I_03805 [Kitasatospora arboriphila]
MHRTPTPRAGRAALALAAAVVLAATTAPAARAHTRPDGGTLILVGGGLKDDNAEIYGEIITKAAERAAPASAS